MELASHPAAERTIPQEQGYIPQKNAHHDAGCNPLVRGQEVLETQEPNGAAMEQPRP